MQDEDVNSEYTTQRFDDNKKHKIVFQSNSGVIRLTVDDQHEISDDGKISDLTLSENTAYLGGISRALGYHKMYVFVLIGILYTRTVFSK